MHPLPYRIASFDIDGTLTIGHGWRFLAERLGRSRDYDAANDEFRRRTVSEDEHLRTLLGLAGGVPLRTIEQLLEETPRISGIAETVRAIADRGAAPVLLTHNPSYVCRWYARRFGFVGWAGIDDGSAPEVVDGIIRAPDEVTTGKLRGLARLLAERRRTPSEVVHVGDGWADAELFPKVGLGIALNSELREVERAADVVLRATDLREVLPILESRPPKRVAATLK